MGANVLKGHASLEKLAGMCALEDSDTCARVHFHSQSRKAQALGPSTSGFNHAINLGVGLRFRSMCSMPDSPPLTPVRERMRVA